MLSQLCRLYLHCTDKVLIKANQDKPAVQTYKHAVRVKMESLTDTIAASPIALLNLNSTAQTHSCFKPCGIPRGTTLALIKQSRN